MDSISNICEKCNKAFKNRHHLLRHIRAIHEGKSYKCSTCMKEFNRLENLKRHMEKHQKQPLESTDMNLHSSKRVKLSEPIHHAEISKPIQQIPHQYKGGRECKYCHRPLPERYYTHDIALCNACYTKRGKRIFNGGKLTSLNGIVESQEILPNESNKCDPIIFFTENEKLIKDYIEEKAEEKCGIKCMLTIQVNFNKITQEEREMSTSPHFTSDVFVVSTSDAGEQLTNSFQQLRNRIEYFQREGSGWQLNKVIKLEIKIADYTPIYGSSYIELPIELRNKKAILNIKNEDEYCFKWAVLAHLHPIGHKDNPNRVSKYKDYESTLDWSGILFPTPLTDVPKFEKKNNISVNVFGFENGEVFPLLITKNSFETHINLLLISDGTRRHFCLIKNMSRLLGDRTKHNGLHYYCTYCMHGFTKEKLLKDHQENCSRNTPQKIKLPDESEKWLKFKNHAIGLKVPFVIYADFECFLEPCSESTDKTEKYQKHVPSGYSFIVVCSDNKYTKPAVVYRGDNVMDEFYKHLNEAEKYIESILTKIVPMSLTPEEQCNFTTAEKCHICGEVLETDRVRNHDHLTGQYRGAAHNKCNFNYKFSKENYNKQGSFHIPVILHNLRGYNSHLLMESLGKETNSKIACIANNMEKYISFSKNNFRFIDSFQFMNTSLSNLVSNLVKDNLNKFRILERHFNDPKKLELATRKGVYPYDYITDSSKFLEQKLPPQEDFFNILNNEKLTPSDYAHAQQVWDIFEINNLGEYHDLYLKTDVLLLADVFENFRDLCLECYKLDPAHFYTSPGLAWEAMLRMTGVTLELLTDPDMYLMIENGIRGGISMISNKHGKANNKYQDDYDPSMTSKYIIYLDANNLYGWSMSEPLPYGEFKWLTDEEVSNFHVEDIPDHSDVGYILEVDLDYPTSLHDQHSDYPLAPEKMVITDDMLSPYSQKLKTNLQLKGQCTSKLIPNLHSKKKYTVHYRNLKFYLQQGMILTKVHKIIQFKQSPWLKKYIDFNTEKRKNASSVFEKDFFKLMNNSVFGETCENLKKRTNIVLVNNEKTMKKLCAKPSFKSFKIFNEHLTAVHKSQSSILLNRPAYVGFVVLDVSKILMYRFHYNVIKKRYGDKAILLFTDTDSLCYLILTDDIYQDMLDNIDEFDTSDYKEDHFLHSLMNKKVLGKMKDECSGAIIDEFVGLRPKMYSLTYGGKEKKTAKGINRRVVDNDLRHQNYKDSLKNSVIQPCTMNQIRSFNHNMYSVKMNKIGLSPFDDKRYVLEDGCTTLAHGHYRTK